MRKLTLFLSLLLTVFITATAEIDTSKEYLIQDVTSGKFLNAANDTAHATGPTGGVNFVNYAGSNSQILTFEASGNGYKLKFKTGKYVYCQQWNVDALDNGTVLTFIENGDGTYYIQKSSTYFKSQEVSGTYYPFCDADASARTKVKLIEVLAPVQEATSGIYEIQNQDTQGSRGYLVHSTSYANRIKLAESKYPDMTNTTFCFQSRIESGVTPYWYVYNSEAGNTYIFSLATGQFINDTSNNNAVALTTTPQPVNIQNVSGTIFNIKSTIRDTYTLTAAVGWEQSGDNVRWHDAATDGGYPFHFIPVSTIIDAGIITVDQDIINNAIEAIKNAEAVPEEEDRSETLTPDFCPVDGDGVKVNAFNGTFSEEQYGYYHKWESEKTVKEWDHTGSVSTSTDVPMVTIEVLKDTYKQDSYKFQYPSNNKNITTFTLSNILSSMKLTAGPGYNIVGYTFSYTTTKAITDFGDYEGEITCDAAGTDTVDVRGLDAKTVEIAFGNATHETLSIYDFYVFVRKGEALTTEFIEYLLGDGTENSGEPGMAFNQAYAIASKKNPNNHLYAPEGKDMLDLCGEGCHNYSDVKVTGSDPYQQFMLIPLAVYGTTKQEGFENCFFLYNVGQRKFVSKEGDFTLLTKYPRNAVEIIAGEGDYEGYFRLNFNKANLLNVSTDFCTDESKSCVVTNNNESGDGNNFYIREVRDFREEDNNQLDEIRIAASYLTDEDTKATLSEKISDVLEHEGVGYPKSKNTLEAVKNDITTDYGSILTCFDLDYYINAYKTTTEVNMPESGKAYRIKTMLNYNSETPTVHYLQGTADGKLTVANSASDNSTIFVAKSLDEANAGTGSFALVNDNGQFLVGARTGTNGFTEQYEQDGNNAALGLESAADRNYFGGFLLKTTEGETTYNLQLGSSTTSTDLVITYDAEDPNSIIADESGCSIFWLEEVSYPNTVSLRSPKEDDGKTYSSIWLPFAVEIPEGVRAYVAHVDEVNSQLVCREIKNVLPADEGAILIGEEALTTNLLPYLGDAAALDNNDLKGTNTTLARNTGVTTFVLNGGKGEIGFYPYTGTNIAKYKAYVEVSNELAAQGLRFAFGPATDIESVITEGEQDAKVYYDLSGRRVAQPTKGLYIVNGKKMYIK